MATQKAMRKGGPHKLLDRVACNPPSQVFVQAVKPPGAARTAAGLFKPRPSNLCQGKASSLFDSLVGAS